MRAAALKQSKRKGTDKTHTHVLGGMRLLAGRIVLFAVEQGHAQNIVRPIRLTDQWPLMYKWRTKQAASQFMHRHELPDLHLFDTHYMDILPAAKS